VIERISAIDTTTHWSSARIRYITSGWSLFFMLRVIFDTNIYGMLLQEKDIVDIEQRLEKDKDFVVYGFSLIRNEL
jgi:hypothetical protein